MISFNCVSDTENERPTLGECLDAFSQFLTEMFPESKALLVACERMEPNEKGVFADMVVTSNIPQPFLGALMKGLMQSKTPEALDEIRIPQTERKQ